MKELIFTFLVLFSLNISAQEKFYTLNNGDKLTESELIDRAEKMEKMLNRTPNKTKFANPIIKDSIVKSDSIIYSVEFRIEKEKKKIAIDQKPLNKYLNEKLLDFQLENLKGESISLKDYKGKPTMINFWFTNCPPCIKELPLLNSLENKYGESYNFVAITFDSAEKVRNFLQNKEFAFQHLVDAKLYTDNLEIGMYPITVILDKNGIVKFTERSFNLEKQGQENIEEKLDQIMSSLN